MATNVATKFIMPDGSEVDIMSALCNMTASQIPETTGRLKTGHCGRRGTAGRKNTHCRGKLLPGHTICTRQEST